MPVLVDSVTGENDPLEECPPFDLGDPNGIKEASQWIAERIGREPEGSITTQPAGAAVQLRRLLATIGERDHEARNERLLTSALAAIEAVGSAA